MENNQKRTNKTATWEAVQAIMAEYKIPKKAAEALELLLAPKAGGGISKNPPKLDKDGNIVEAWCKYPECYEPIDNMVVSNDKPKGYCKAAASKSNRLRKESKDLDTKVIELMADGNMEEAQKIAIEAKKLSSSLNNPSLYDLDKDWAEFNGSTKDSE